MKSSEAQWNKEETKKMKHVYRILTTVLLLVGSQGQSYGQSASDNAELESYRWIVVMQREAVAVAREDLDFATRHLGNAELVVTEARNPEPVARLAEIEVERERLEAERERLEAEIEAEGYSRRRRERSARLSDTYSKLIDSANEYPHLVSAERHLSVSRALMLATQSVLSAQEAAIVSAEALVAAAETASVSGDATRLNVALSTIDAVLEAVNITLTERNNISETDASTHRERRWPRQVYSGRLANAWSSAARAARAAERAQEIVAALNSGNGVVPPELLEPLPSEPFFSVA